MSSAAGRVATGNRRGSAATPTPMPAPSAPCHQRPRLLANSWLSSSPPSASNVANSPPTLLHFPFATTSPRNLATHAIAHPASPASTDEPLTFSRHTHATARQRSGALSSHTGAKSPADAGCSSAPSPLPTSRCVRWPAPARSRAVRASAVASPPAPTAHGASGPGPGPGGPPPAARPPSPSFTPPSSSYFEGFCPESATECSTIWGQLRWCSNWRQMRQLYDNLIRAEEAAAAATAAIIAQIGAAAAAGGDGNSSGSGSDSPTASIDITAAAVSAAVGSDLGAAAAAAAAAGSAGAAAAGSAGAAAAGSTGAGGVGGGGSVRGGSSSSAVPGLLSRDETYAFLLQLQDFYHLELQQSELGELQAFRCRLVRDLSAYVRRLDAEQLEALCCASAVSGQCLTRERADAAQERLLKILTVNSSAATPHSHSTHSHGNSTHSHGNSTHSHGPGHGDNSTHGQAGSSSSDAGAGAAGSRQLQQQQQQQRRRRSGPTVGGFQVLTPALNTIFALYDHGYLPQVALLQAVFRQAVDHCCEVTRSQWHGLHGLARRFRFLVDDMWLDDLHAALRDPLACTTDFGRLASILGCISAFTVNKAMEALDTRVLMVVEAIERRFDEGRSLLTPHQLCVFTAMLVDMQSPFRTKWLGYCLNHLNSCRSHLAGLPPATLVLAVELVLRGKGWDEQRLLSKLLRQLFSTYALHPAAALRAKPNVSGCPPRAPSRIITAMPTSSSSSSASAIPPSLAAMAAAAAWDFDVGGAGGAASPPLDLASLVDWIASKVPAGPGPERTDTLEFLKPLVSELVEGGRGQLASLPPARIPGLIKAVALLGYSPSREWVAEAFTRVAGGAESLSGSELVAMLRVSHAQRLPLPHSTLDAVCGQHARILPLMRAVDLQRLLECWVADRYIPSREQLEGFFDAVCDVFGLDLHALKAAAASPSTSPGPSSSGSYSPLVSFDSDSAAVPSAGPGSGPGPSGAAAPAGAAAPSGGRGGSAGGGGGERAGRGSRSVYSEIGMLQSAGGVVSAGAADGVAGAAMPLRRSAGRSGAASGGTKPAAAAGVPSALSSAAGKAAADATAAVIAADAAAAAAAAGVRPPTASLGSLDDRPKGSLLQPAEAQSMLQLLDQYRALLLEAKRSDLLIVMNTYRNAVTAALHDMRKVAGSARPPASSRLLQAVLRGAPP